MRRSIFLTLLFAVSMVPPVPAHGGGVPHVNPIEITLDPDESQALHLEFEEGAFGAGWVFLLNIILLEGNGTIDVELYSQEALEAEWTFSEPQVTQYLTGLMRIEGEYALVFTNPSEEAIRFEFFYDQSCNCLSKPIPPDVPHGMVLFQVDVEKRETWKARFEEPPVHDLLMTMARRVNETSRWPTDFEILDTSLSIDNATPNHTFEWTASATERYYFFAQSIEADLSKFNTSSPESAVLSVTIFPSFEKRSEASSIPLDPVLTVVAVGIALTLAGHRRRNRPG